MLHARPENNKPNAGYQESYRERCWDLCGFFFVHSCFDGTEFGHFFLLVVVEIGMDQSNHTQNQKDDSKSDDQALHTADPFLIGATGRAMPADATLGWLGARMSRLTDRSY
ncbi:MAG: hypothetical protein AUG47_05315 [Alphaproteobacteria bacterium 13_1_20CM_3_64_12]|nr:MAG: hypothetical protein AUG47_05315 [Alphaproteobacteria bacterium 13_1_20CM_3_64_12]